MSAPATWSERSIGAGGTRLFLREIGSGPPVLLLHGFPQTGACWRRVAESLAARHRVLIPDLPGYGRSERPLSFDVRTLAVTMSALLKAAGAPRATVVGHDWGGAIAYRMALDPSDSVERLVAVNSPFRRLNLARSWHLLLFNVPVLPEVAFSLAGDRIVTLALHAGSRVDDAFEPEAVAEYVAAFRSLERQRAAFAYYRTVTRSAIARTLPVPWRRGSGDRTRIDVPTMVVWGMRDPALPASLLDGIRDDIPHARIEPIEDAGHFVPEERPKVLADLLLEFAGRGRR